MANMAALRAKYFAASAELAPGEATDPYQSAGNTVTTLVDGHAYFGALRTEVNRLADKFVLRRIEAGGAFNSCETCEMKFFFISSISTMRAAKRWFSRLIRNNRMPK